MREIPKRASELPSVEERQSSEFGEAEVASEQGTRDAQGGPLKSLSENICEETSKAGGKATGSRRNSSGSSQRAGNMLCPHSQSRKKGLLIRRASDTSSQKGYFLSSGAN